MKVSLPLLILLFTCYVNSQEIYSRLEDDLFKDNNVMMFSFKEHSYIMSSDSLYTITKKPVEAKAHGLALLKYNFVSDQNNGYLVNASNGIVFSFDGEKFNRLDNSFEFKTQYDHFPFIRNGSFHTFGGYGLFTFKNIITRFNSQLRETELIRSNSSTEKSPPGMHSPIGQYINNHLYVAAGKRYNHDPNTNNNSGNYYNKLWSFNFNNNQWLYLGKLKTDLSLAYTPEFIFNNEALYFNSNQLISLDFSQNKLTRYLQPGIPVETIADLTYNKNLDGYFYFKKITKFKKELHFIKRLELLGTQKEIDQIYSTPLPWYFYGSIIVLVAILTFAFYNRKKITLESKIRKKHKRLYKILSSSEIELLEMLLKASPEYVSFQNLLKLYDSNLSYDSLKKKLRADLESLDQKLISFFKLKRTSCLEERKCIDDARNKEVRLLP